MGLYQQGMKKPFQLKIAPSYAATPLLASHYSAQVRIVYAY